MTPRLYAHRGAAVELPENTLPSFALALELGADALEMDVHLTSDAHVVVSHDADGHRLAGRPHAIASSTLAEVKTWDVGIGFSAGTDDTTSGRRFEVPTLDEVLEEFPDTIINVDLKAPDSTLVQAALTCIHGHRAAERVQLASFHVRNLIEVRRTGYRGQTALAPAEVALAIAGPAFALRHLPLMGTAAQLPTKAEFFRQSEQEGAVRASEALWRRLPWADTIAELPRRLYPSDGWMIERMRRLGLRVDFWTVNDAAEAVALAELGADGIMTDDPRTIARALGRSSE